MGLRVFYGRREEYAKKRFTNKGLSLLLSASLCVGMMSTLSGCGSKKDEVIKLDVYSQLANFSGKQTVGLPIFLKDKLV